MVLGQVVAGVGVDDLQDRHGGRVVVEPLFEDDERDTSYGNGSRPWRDVAVLGVGMHPSGASGAATSSSTAWPPPGCTRRRRRHVARHPVRRRRRHDPQRLPRLRRGRDVRAGAGLDRRAGGVVVRGLRVGRDGAVGRAGAHPRRAVRRRAGGRRRHDAEGVPRADRRRPSRRSGLVALPAPGRDQPDLLRPVRPPAHGPVRRDRSRLRAGQGEERPARPAQPERPLPQARSPSEEVLASPVVASIRCACSTSAPRPTAALRSSCRAWTTRARLGVAAPGAGARGLDGHAAVPEHRHRDAELRDGLGRGAGTARAHVPGLIAAAAYEEAGVGPEDLDLAEVYDLSTALELDWYENIGLCKAGEAERLLRDGDTTIGGRIPVNPSRRAGVLRRGRSRPGDRPGVRGHVAAAGPGRRPAGRGCVGGAHGQPRLVRPRLVRAADPVAGVRCGRSCCRARARCRSRTCPTRSSPGADGALVRVDAHRDLRVGPAPVPRHPRRRRRAARARVRRHGRGRRAPTFARSGPGDRCSCPA